MEVVNGYTELTDPVIQRNIMKEQAKLKGDEFEYDEEYCNALEFGLVPCAGIGIGINRLIMWLLGKSNIKDVLSFPFYK
jgi:lysyl-tRNA synthetase class 2